MTETSKSSLKSQVQIRSATESDVAFVFNSWLKSYRNSNSCKSISNPVYFDFQHKVIEKLLARCVVLVVCEATDPSQIYGYIVYESVEGIPILHYAYVKHAFRGMGICSMLFAEAQLNKDTGGFYTHETPSAMKLLVKSKFVYNPYLATT